LKYNNSGTALLLVVNASKQWHPVPHLHFYHLKRRPIVASYVQPVIQQYKSTTILKELQQSK